MSLNGIDVSNWKAGMDLGAVPADFVIMKATEGTTYVDKTCNGYVEQCKRLGKLWGFYHFMDNKRDGATQAEFFVSRTKNYFGQGIPFLDYEMYGRIGAGQAWSFMSRVHELTGVWPMIYMSKSEIHADNWTQVAKYCGLWVAQYANNKPTGYQSNPWTDKSGYGAFGSPEIFQYTSSGRLAGYNGSLDLNIAYLTRDQWMAFARGDNQEPKSDVASVGLWETHGKDNQQFFVEWVDDKTFKLKSVSCGKYLDVEFGSTDNGARVICYPATGGKNQLWQILETNGRYTPDFNKPIEIMPVIAPDKRLDVNAQSAENGAKIQIWEANHGPAQLWQVLDKGDGKWVLVNVNSAKALDVLGGGK